MLGAERLEIIQNLVIEHGFLTVEELSKELDVSLMTIRRDLDRLSAKGVIERCYGGATYRAETSQEKEYALKKSEHHTIKQSIAYKAIDQIRDGDTLFLDSGTTTFEIAPLLKKRNNLTVFTNDLAIASYLQTTDVNLFLIGGQVQKETGTLIGETALDMLSHFRFSVSFIGAMAIDAAFQVLSPTIEKAYFKQKILSVSSRNFLVADSSKFYQQAMVSVCNLDRFTGVITDRNFSSGEMKKIDEKGIMIIHAEGGSLCTPSSKGK